MRIYLELYENSIKLFNLYTLLYIMLSEFIAHL